MKRKSNWKKSSVLTLSLLIAAAASGCSSSGNADQKSVAQDGKDDGKPLQIQIFGGLYNDMPDMNNAYWTEYQKRLNVKLDATWVLPGEFDTKLELMLASGDLPEVLAYPNSTSTNLSMINAMRGGAFWDLTPFLGDFSQYPNLKNNTPPNWTKFNSIDGKIYGLPRSRSIIDLSLTFRKDWLDKLGLSVPTTLEEYRNVLKQVSNGDPDGNGKKDTMGLLGLTEDQMTIIFEDAFGATKPNFNSEGGLIWHQLTDQYSDMVNYFRQLYQDGSLPKEFTVMKRTQMEEALSTGKAASYGRTTRYQYDWEVQAKKVQPDANFIALPPMKGPGGFTVDLAPGVNGGIFISKKVPEAKVKQLLKYFDATASKEITDLGYNGIEGVHYNMVNGQRVPTELALKEVNTMSLGAGVMAVNAWGKVENPAAPKAYNDEKRKQVADYEKLGTSNPFNWLISDTWISAWPKYSNEWTSMMTKAIVGQISMDEYKAYVNKLNNTPEIKQAYKEFAKQYNSSK